jgi:ribosomal protein S19
MISNQDFLLTLKAKGVEYDTFKNLTETEQEKFYCARIRRSLNRLRIYKRSVHHIIYENMKDNTKEYKIQKKEIILLPWMVGKTFKVHNGKTYVPITVKPEMLNKYIGAFVMCKMFPKHNIKSNVKTGSKSSGKKK